MVSSNTNNFGMNGFSLNGFTASASAPNILASSSGASTSNLLNLTSQLNGLFTPVTPSANTQSTASTLSLGNPSNLTGLSSSSSLFPASTSSLSSLGSGIVPFSSQLSSTANTQGLTTATDSTTQNDTTLAAALPLMLQIITLLLQHQQAPPSNLVQDSTNNAINPQSDTPDTTTDTQTTPSPVPPSDATATTVTSVPSSKSGDTVKLFGGSQSGENNIAFANKSDKDMLVYAQKGLQPGEKDPGGTLFKVPAHSNVTVDALENNGLRFQEFNDKLTSKQQAQLTQNGVVNGITAPAKTGTLYESNYIPDKHLSYDDISPLDGANVAMSMAGTGGRTVHFTQAQIDGAPVHNADGSVPGLGPSASSTDNAAANPALRDYYKKTSLQADGTRDFYYNSSVGGDADKANVSYTGAAGKIRTTVTLG